MSDSISVPVLPALSRLRPRHRRTCCRVARTVARQNSAAYRYNRPESLTSTPCKPTPPSQRRPPNHTRSGSVPHLRLCPGIGSGECGSVGRSGGKEALRSGRGCRGQGPPLKHRFDAGRLDQVQFRLPTTRGQPRIGITSTITSTSRTGGAFDINGDAPPAAGSDDFCCAPVPDVLNRPA
jgi:hypothetical protein